MDPGQPIGAPPNLQGMQANPRPNIWQDFKLFVEEKAMTEGPHQTANLIEQMMQTGRIHPDLQSEAVRVINELRGGGPRPMPKPAPPTPQERFRFTPGMQGGLLGNVNS